MFAKARFYIEVQKQSLEIVEMLDYSLTTQKSLSLGNKKKRKTLRIYEASAYMLLILFPHSQKLLSKVLAQISNDKVSFSLEIIVK